MTGDEATVAVIDALEALGIPYMLVGSLSTNLYGIPRSSEGADFVLQLGPQSLFQLGNYLGPQFQLDPHGSFETVTMTLRHILAPVGVPFQIELFHLSEDPHDQERFRRRRRVKLLGREVSVPRAEDAIVTKIRWAAAGRRPKDREDARAVMAVQGDRIDWGYVNSWCDRHGSRALLEELRQSIPPI